MFGHLLFRSDGSSSMGTGHVMRCLALAQCWNEGGGEATLVSSELPASLKERVESEGIATSMISVVAGSCNDARATASECKRLGARAVVVDGYQFKADYRAQLKSEGLKILLIDDNGDLGPYDDDLILNQNLQATKINYGKQGGVLLGTEYVLLRRDISRRDPEAKPPAAKNLLVTLGGADPHGTTAAVLEALREVKARGLDCRILVGAANSSYERLSELARELPFSATVAHDVRDMGEVYAWADLAITAAGTTCWELAYMGVPALTVILADNQVLVAEEAERRGIAWNLGWHSQLDKSVLASRIDDLLADASTRAAMSSAGRALVDGAGAVRAALAIAGDVLYLRPARLEDAKLIFEWSNDALTREQSFNSRPIEWKEHATWLKSRLADPASLLLVARASNGRPAGLVRFSLTGDEADIGVSLAPEKRGLGLAAPLIDEGCRRLFARSGVKKIHAYVKMGNEASTKAFRRAGFAESGIELKHGYDAFHFTRDRNG